MLSGARYRHTVQHLEKVKVKITEKIICSPLLHTELAPRIESLLCLPENLVYGFFRVELAVDLRSIALIGQGKLVAQIIKAVIDRRGREHQHLCLDPGPDDLVQKLQITVLFLILAGNFAAIAEVMALVNHDQVIVAPIQTIQVKAIGAAACSGQIRMEQHVIAHPVTCNGIVFVIVLVCIPVPGQLFRAENQYRLVSVFVVFNDSQRGKGFAEANTVSQYAAVVLFQLVYDRKDSIPLKVIEHTPYFALLETCCLVGQHVFGYIFKELAEHIVEQHEVNKLRSVFVIGRSDVVDDFVGHILQLALVIPKRIE